MGALADNSLGGEGVRLHWERQSRPGITQSISFVLLCVAGACYKRETDRSSNTILHFKTNTNAKWMRRTHNRQLYSATHTDYITDRRSVICSTVMQISSPETSKAFLFFLPQCLQNRSNTYRCAGCMQVYIWVLSETSHLHIQKTSMQAKCVL